MNASISEDKKDLIVSQLLGLFNAQIGTQPILEEAVDLLREYLGCSAVGIRIMDEQGNIPYKAHSGYSEAFLAKEGPLCIRHDRCACIEITKGEYDPSSPLYTLSGSFFTDELQSLSLLRDGMKTGRFRGECVKLGYETLALVPIRFAHRYFGLIQLIDERRGGVTRSELKFVENVAGQLGLYLNGLHSRAEKEREFAFLVDRIVHDMRSPLTAAALSAELIATKQVEADDPEILELIDSISRNTGYIGSLVSGLSEFAGGCNYTKTELDELDLEVFVSKIVTDMPELGESGVRVVVPPGLPMVRYPSFCLRRVLSNLLSNAAKYASNGTPATVEVSCQKKDMFYQLSVSDNGKGMDVSEVTSIFQPFYRVKGSEEVPGAGLGLSICKNIVEKHGGNIWAYSSPGQGSTFYFTIPK
jgi:signal transduction histidine kinase